MKTETTTSRAGVGSAAPCSALPPNLVQAGDLWVCEDESRGPDKIEYALLIQCANPQQVRDAMKSGKIEFTLFEHYPPNETALATDQNQTESKPPDAEQPSGKGLDGASCSTFASHKEQTAKDLESLIEMLTQLAAEIREGNMKKWEEFWYKGGTEEGDAKIFAIREMLILRYAYREESIESNTKIAGTAGDGI